MKPMKDQGTTTKAGAAGLACLLAFFASGCSPASDQGEDSQGSASEQPSDEKDSGESQAPSEQSEGSEGASSDQGSSKGSKDDAEGSGSQEDSGDAGDPEPEEKAEVPDEFKGKTNPFEDDDAKALEAGEALYEEHCQGCHGKEGGGEIPGMPDMSTKSLKEWPDDWTYWKVLKGSSEMMPAAEGVLSEEEIWQCITYVRTLAD